MFAIALVGLSRAVEGARKSKDRLATTLVTTAFVVALLPLVSLLWQVFSKGAPVVSSTFLTSSMRNVVGEGGGIYHAIWGTVLVTGMATIMSVPIGLLTAIYLVEYGGGRLAKSITFLVDVMTGIPSIVAGLFAYALFAIFFGPGVRMGFGGAVALSLLMVPLVVRSGEEMLKLVPHDLREASYALGVPKWRTITKVVLPTALAGIVTGSHDRHGPGDRRDRAAADHLRRDRLDELQPVQRPHDDAAGLHLRPVQEPRHPGVGERGPGVGSGVRPHRHRHDAQPHRTTRVPLLLTQDKGMMMTQTVQETRRKNVAKSIDVSDLNIYYGSFLAVEGVTIPIAARSVTALIGPSGCGKSTFLRSLNRMHEVIPGARVRARSSSTDATCTTPTSTRSRYGARSAWSSSGRTPSPP